MQSPLPQDEPRNRDLRKLRADLGPVALEALGDPKTVEVLLNADGRLWQERLGEPLREIGTMPAMQADAVIRCVAAILRTTVTRENPILEGELPDGSRFAGQIPPVVSAPVFDIRKRASAVFTLDQYVEQGIMTPGQMEVLCEAIWDHRNILVSGSTGSGKTTLVNGLIAELTRQYPDERLLILEDTSEIQCAARNSVKYLTSPEVSMTRLLRMTMRMRPDRILVGEVRGPEALDLLMALNTGHPGGICTLHANDARAALSRLSMLISMHRESPREIDPLIGEAQPLVVHICRDPDRGRVVREIVGVQGYEGNGYQLQAL